LHYVSLSKYYYEYYNKSRIKLHTKPVMLNYAGEYCDACQAAVTV